MILNVSGRTDIVAFYSEWFMNRIKAGYFDVRNPFFPKHISRIYLKNIDLIFFCTKNPIPILDKIKEIPVKTYFHVTLTPYKNDIEVNVIDKKKIIEAIKKLSSLVGEDNVVIRYDPVFINDIYTLEYHKKAFERICFLLDGYVHKILISFLDDYKNVRNHKNIIQNKKLDENDYREIGISFSESARKHHMTVHTCFEDRDLVEYGFIKDECMSRELAFKLTGNIYKEEWKARKERKCHCVSMVDIGVYNSCSHFCKYCYANYDEKKVLENMKNHSPTSSLLIGEIDEDDIIKERV